MLISNLVKKGKSICFISFIVTSQGNSVELFIVTCYQNSEELVTYNVTVVTFLKDCHNTITTGVEIGYCGNTPLLCMLARYVSI